MSGIGWLGVICLFGEYEAAVPLFRCFGAAFAEAIQAELAQSRHAKFGVLSQ